MLKLWNISSRKLTATGRILSWCAVGLWFAAANAAWSTQSVSIGWNAAPDPSVKGYAVYVGKTSGNYTTRIDVGSNTMATVTGLKEGTTNYITVTSYNAASVESLPAGELPFLAPGVVALNPGLRITDPMNVSFPVVPGHWYELQTTARTDMKLWTTVWRTPVQSANVWIGYQDKQSPILARRFYRLVLH